MLSNFMDAFDISCYLGVGLQYVSETAPCYVMKDNIKAVPFFGCLLT